jgi:uncharacterized membrane protein
MFEWFASCPEGIKWTLAILAAVLFVVWAAALRFNQETRDTPGDWRRYLAWAIFFTGLSIPLLPLNAWHIGHLAIVVGAIVTPMIIGFAMIRSTDDNLRDIDRQIAEGTLTKKDKWKARTSSYVPGAISVVAGISGLALLGFVSMPGYPSYEWWLALTVNIGLVLVAIGIHLAKWSSRWLYWVVMVIAILGIIAMMLWAWAGAIRVADENKPEPPPAKEDVLDTSEDNLDCPERFRLTDEDGDGQVDEDVIIAAAAARTPESQLLMMSPEALIKVMEDAGIWEKGEYTPDEIIKRIGDTTCFYNPDVWYDLAEKYPDAREGINEELIKLDLEPVPVE